MKKTKNANVSAAIVILLLVAGIVLISGCTEVENGGGEKIQKCNLNEAIKNDWVKVERIYGVGSSSGDSIMIDVKRVVNYTLEIEIEVGREITTSISSEQNMAIRRIKGKPMDATRYEPAVKITLDTQEIKTYILEAYCLEFDKDNPSGQNRFSIGGINTEIKKIFNAADELPDAGSIAAIQIAIWVMTDDISRQDIEEKLDISEGDIQNAKTLLETAGVDISHKRLF